MGVCVIYFVWVFCKFPTQWVKSLYGCSFISGFGRDYSVVPLANMKGYRVTDLLLSCPIKYPSGFQFGMYWSYRLLKRSEHCHIGSVGWSLLSNFLLYWLSKIQNSCYVQEEFNTIFNVMIIILNYLYLSLLHLT